MLIKYDSFFVEKAEYFSSYCQTASNGKVNGLPIKLDDTNRHMHFVTARIVKYTGV